MRRFFWLLSCLISCSHQAQALAAASSPPPRPQIHQRSELGLSDVIPDVEEDVPKVRIIVHHTDIVISSQTKKLDAGQSWEAAKAHYHQVRDGHIYGEHWSDIGYHYLVDWEGRILVGRPLHLLGAHTFSYNAGSVGIALMGDIENQHATPKQLESLQDLISWILYSHKQIAPSQVYGHQDFNSTHCPGHYLDDPKDADSPFKRMKKRLMASLLLTPKLSEKRLETLPLSAPWLINGGRW
ncbi:MAG: N-acetylmuramoyl-L-alanine amidase [Elusimicrobia bacterium]|nr:N-acetylmuramoyl-L-alanine amidase [Elusimicrobiota bacterium]